MQRSKRLAGLAALSCAAFAAGPASAQAAELFHGVTDTNRLVQFTSDAPQDVTGGVPISGLQPNENVVGLDVRPASDALYALTNQGRIYQVNPLTGATRIFTTSPALDGTQFGVDVNPVPDALRITSDTEQNLRVRFDNGNGTTDTNLQYAEGDPGAGSNPAVTAVAYTNSRPNATETQLFGIDAARDALVRIDPPNAGTLRTVGALGTDIGEAIGFDITAENNTGYALVLPQGGDAAQLVRVDLGTGRVSPAATDSTIDLPQGRLRGLAAAGPVPDDKTAPEASVAFSSTILEQNTNTLRPSVSCDETCAITVAATVAGRAAGTGRAALVGPGRVTVPVALSSAARRRIARPGNVLITLRITVVDAAGNERAQTRQSRTQTLAARRAG